jgi:glycosyltransferase involved in cell wall biosynthesis
MKIYFLEKSIPFNANDLDKNTIGGSEKTLINISKELAKYKELDVKVFNENIAKIKIDNVDWINIIDFEKYSSPDVLISYSDVNLFNSYKAKKKFLWSHSVQSFEKFIRKNQFINYLFHKPILILEGEYHYKTRSILTSFFGKKVLKLAPDYDFINEKISIDKIPSKNCIFTTRSNRNLDLLLKAWKKVSENNKDASLMINSPYKLNDELIKQNIVLRTKGNKMLLINDLKKSRLMLNPGHKGEVFCLAAEEARAMCIPIVTLGIGSLYERVIHNKTGFIAKSLDEFINYTNILLNNDELYIKFRNNLFNLRNIRNYSHVAKDLLNIITI